MSNTIKIFLLFVNTILLSASLYLGTLYFPQIIELAEHKVETDAVQHCFETASYTSRFEENGKQIEVRTIDQSGYERCLADKEL